MTLQYPWASNLGPLQIVHVTLNAINDLGRSPQLVWGVFWVDLKYVVFKAQIFFSSSTYCYCICWDAC